MQVAVERSETPLSVMLVDDDRDMVEALAVALESAGYQTDRCYDGCEAIEHLNQGSLPDLIILDLGMPRVNGWQFRVEQRSHQAWASIPVIVLSADSSAPARAIDADRYLAKPVSAPALLETVGHLMTVRETARHDVQTVEPDRLSSLGLLLAGLAHEVNNPLAAVLGNLELASRQCREMMSGAAPSTTDASKSVLGYLGRARQGADRIANVMRGMSTFARSDPDRTPLIDVQDVMEASLLLMSTEVRYYARLERDYEAASLVRASPSLLGEVFINLLLDALDAIRDTPSTQHVIRVATRLRGDEKVVVTVSDSSRDSKPLTQRTSDASRGRYMRAQRLVLEMGGTIGSEREPGGGRTVTMTLPVHVALRHRSLIDSHDVAEKRPSVLIIDDEPMMCSMLSELLSEHFDVTAFHSPRAALERLLCGGQYDVILCDIMMRELSGMRLYAEITRVQPQHARRFIFMTGGAFTPSARDFVSAVRAPVLAKPFDPAVLHQTIFTRLSELAPFTYH